MAAKTALEAVLGSSWGGVGGSWASLGASLGTLPGGGPQEAPGTSGEGLREAFLVLLQMPKRQRPNKRPKTC